MDACEDWMVEAGMFGGVFVLLDDVGADACACCATDGANFDAADDGVLQDAL
jgi:hypothetical protein